MKKKVLFLSILCLLFVTLSYTYSSFNNTIVGTITANVKDWVFKVSVDNGTIKDGGYNLHLSGTSGSFNININTNGSKSGADYTIELIGDSSIKFYTDSSYTNLINNNIYSGSIYSNTNSSVTIYYKSDTTINSDILIKTKGTIMEIATMKNGNYGFNRGTAFWNNTYKLYIRTITFDNNLSNLPSTCNEENLCWDISESSTQKKKVYGYLVDTGLKDKTDNSQPLYNLYIVSNYEIFAPSNCSAIFSFYDWKDRVEKTNLISINFNNNFNTANVTNMASMFYQCKFLTSLNLSNFNTANVTDMSFMFHSCYSLTNLDLSSFNTAKVTDMMCMFYYCTRLTSLDLSGFNTSNVTNMKEMLEYCISLTTTINIMNANVSDYFYMFSNAATNSGSQITVNYIETASTLVDNMIASKSSSNSNVVKGSIIPEYSITITGNDDIKYESINRLKGTKVTLTSISGNNYVTSFKMNGTTINGNEFIMPNTDVTISDIATTPGAIYETSHNPYPDEQDNVILGEHTFEGAKSLTVILDYETQGTWAAYFLIYDSSTSTTGINNNKKYGGSTRTQETITINSNYIKITFTSDGYDNNYYGLKAIVIPNY